MKKIYSLMMLIMSLFVAQTAQALTYTVTVPEGTQTCFIAGTMNGWSPARMTKVDGVANQFAIEIANATELDQYKYLSGPAWDYEEAIDAQGTGLAENRTWTANDIVAFWKGIFVLDERTVTIDVWTPMDVYEMYIVGPFNNWSGSFTDEYKMTMIGEEEGGKVFSISINYFDAYNMEFKFVAGPDWAFQQKQGNFKYESRENTKALIMQTADFEEIYNPELADYITVNATVPAGTEEVWLQGSLFGWGWDNPDAMKMTKNADGTFSYKTFKPIQKMSYRLYNGAGWDYPEVGEDDPTKERSNREVSYVADGDNVSITVYQWLIPGTSSISNLDNDKINISCEKGQVIVEGEFSKIELYTVTGTLVQSQVSGETFTSNALASGLYIISVDGAARKVIVK